MAEYEIRVKDTSGARVALLTGTGRTVGGLQRFSFYKQLRLPGQFSVDLDGSDERIESFTLDAQVEFWRRDHLWVGSDWYNVMEGFHRWDDWRQDADGRDFYVSRGQHYNVMLLAEPTRYPAGSAYTDKSGPAETVAKEFVNENIGPAAISPPRDASGVMPGLSVEASAGTGATWSGARSNQNLHDVLVELADYAPADYMILGTGPATFEFQWRANQWGNDRTQGNAAGNAPVVFSPRLRNVANVQYSHNRTDEINVVYVLGEGVGDERQVVTVTTGQENDSPWARRAVCRDARTVSYDDLADKGWETLNKMESQIETKADVMQTTATRFGRDWDLGDLVTLEYRDFSVTQKIVAVQVVVDIGGAETITAMMEDA